MITAIIFFVALALIVLMMSLKAHEIKKGKKLLFSRLAERTDNFFEKMYKGIKDFISFANKQTAIALIQWIAYHILSWIRTLYLKLHDKAHAHPHSKKVIDMVRGKGEVHKGGGASFYLKKISGEK